MKHTTPVIMAGTLYPFMATIKLGAALIVQTTVHRAARLKISVGVLSIKYTIGYQRLPIDCNVTGLADLCSLLRGALAWWDKFIGSNACLGLRRRYAYFSYGCLSIWIAMTVEQLGVAKERHYNGLAVGPYTTH